MVHCPPPEDRSARSRFLSRTDSWTRGLGRRLRIRRLQGSRSAGLLLHAAVPSVPVDLPSPVHLLVERHVRAMVQMLAVGRFRHPAARLEGEVTETRDVSESH